MLRISCYVIPFLGTMIKTSSQLVASIDAYPVGFGVVISHMQDDGTEKFIAYAFKTLTSAEKNYPQIERYGLAIDFEIGKFHLYLYGR